MTSTHQFDMALHNAVSTYCCFNLFHLCCQEFEELWPQLDVIYDGGVLGLSEEQRLGSTVVNLSKAGYFSIIRSGRYVSHCLTSPYSFSSVCC